MSVNRCSGEACIVSNFGYSLYIFPQMMSDEQMYKNRVHIKKKKI